MNTLNLVIYIVSALVTLGSAARFVGKWLGRIISELVTQTEVFRDLSKQQTLIYRGILRIEKRQLEDRQERYKQNGLKT